VRVKDYKLFGKYKLRTRNYKFVGYNYKYRKPQIVSDYTILNESKVSIYKRVGPHEIEVLEKDKFVRLMQEDLTPSEAANKMGCDLGTLMRNPVIQDLMTKWAVSQDSIKSIGRARMLQILVEGENKDSIAAYNALTKETGPVVAIQQNFSNNREPETKPLPKAPDIWADLETEKG